MKRLAFLDYTTQHLFVLITCFCLCIGAYASATEDEPEENSGEKIYPVIEETVVSPNKDGVTTPLLDTRPFYSISEEIELFNGTLDFLNLNEHDIEPSIDNSLEIENDRQHSDS